jgi:transposase InsO family protein
LWEPVLLKRRPQAAGAVWYDRLNEQIGQLLRQCPYGILLEKLENELVKHGQYATRQATIKGITEYIEVFYNRQRIQAKLGYLSPVAYEQQYYHQKAAA